MSAMGTHVRHVGREAHAGARGFSMMEILVALIVIAIGVFSMTALIPAGTRSNTKAGQQTRGSELASVTMERLLSTPYGDPDLDAGNHSDPNNPLDGGYFVTWVVEVDQPITRCKRITVETHWPTATATNQVRLIGVNPQANDEAP